MAVLTQALQGNESAERSEVELLTLQKRESKRDGYLAGSHYLMLSSGCMVESYVIFGFLTA